jgi:ABC-2 type transport system permease protein
MACYLAYSFIYIVVSVGVSARASSSRNALLTLLTVWIFTCIIIPKATVNIASNLHPIPSSFAFNQAIKEDESKGIDGHDSEDARAKVLEKQILAKYKVDSVSQLPVNFDAIQMQEGEKYTSTVYNKHFSNLQNTYNAQNQVSEITSLVNPYLAIRQLSMALSGSDYVTHADFQQQAEKHRFELVALMNNYMRDHSKTGNWEFTVNKEVWSQLPEFQYQIPDFSSIISRNWLSFLSIALWVCLGIWGISTLKFSLS